MAGLASQYASEEALLEADLLLDREASSEDMAECSAIDIQFHTLIAKNSSNHLYHRIIKSVLPQLKNAQSIIYNTHRRRRIILEGHQEILLGLNKRDAAAAWQAMTQHIDAVASMVLK